MFWNKKEKARFKRGDVVSNGTYIYRVNLISKNSEGEDVMLIDEILWSKSGDGMIQYCKETLISDKWYKLK